MVEKIFPHPAKLNVVLVTVKVFEKKFVFDFGRKIEAVRIVYKNFVKKRVLSIFKGYFKKLKTLYQKSAVVRFLGYL